RATALGRGSSSRPHNVVPVLNIVRQPVQGDVAEAGLGEQLTRFLFAPHGPKSFASGGERDGHAVHAGDGVEQGSDRVVLVLVVVAGGADVLHQEAAAGAQGAGDVGQHLAGFRLVVDR